MRKFYPVVASAEILIWSLCDSKCCPLMLYLARGQWTSSSGELSIDKLCEICLCITKGNLYKRKIFTLLAMSKRTRILDTEVLYIMKELVIYIEVN